jgi:hypothetical protein
MILFFVAGYSTCCGGFHLDLSFAAVISSFKFASGLD